MRMYWQSYPTIDDHRVSIIHPSLRSIVKSGIKHYFGTFIYCTIILWTILSIFFGANYKRSELVHNLTIDLVDLDGGPTGQEITNIIMDIPQQPSNPTWWLRTDIDNIEQARVYARNDAWGVLVINHGLSSRLSNALETGVEYDPALALTILKQGSYHPMAQPLYIQSTMASMASALSAQLAARQIAEFKALASETAKTSVNMQALLHPISSKEEDLGPYNLELSTLIPPLTMLLMTLCVLVPLMMLKFGAYPLYKQANHIQVFTSAALIVFGLCVIFSLFGALVFLAFKGPNYNTQLQGLPINGGRFFKIWMSYLLTLLPTMLWLKSLSLVVPTTYAAVPSVMTIIPNVCSAIVALELCPPFFKWFQAMPFFQGCMLTRYVVSGAHNRLGENLGVLFGELAFSLLLLFACTALHQRNVCLGVVNFMGNYNITWSDTAVGKRKPVQQPAPTTDRILESGDQPQRVSFSSEAVPITDEYTTAQDTMRNRTLAI